MKITRAYVNFKSEDEFESLFEFDDGYIIAGSEKDIVVISPDGKEVGTAHKAVLDEPHSLFLQNQFEIGLENMEDLTDEAMRRRLQIMGPHSAIPRDDVWYRLRDGELVAE